MKQRECVLRRPVFAFSHSLDPEQTLSRKSFTRLSYLVEPSPGVGDMLKVAEPWRFGRDEVNQSSISRWTCRGMLIGSRAVDDETLMLKVICLQPSQR